MPKLNIYLNFPGNTEEVFNFYKSVFGGEFNSVIRYRDMPMPGVTLSKEDENKLMHISLPIGKNDALMASDNLESMGQPKVTPGNNIYISYHPDTKEEADRVWNALSAGGKIEMEIAEQPWGDYWGSFTDKYGVMWMVDLETEKSRDFANNMMMAAQRR